MSVGWLSRITTMDCLKSALLAYIYDSTAILPEASRLTSFGDEPLYLSNKVLHFRRGPTLRYMVRNPLNKFYTFLLLGTSPLITCTGYLRYPFQKERS